VRGGVVKSTEALVALALLLCKLVVTFAIDKFVLSDILPLLWESSIAFVVVYWPVTKRKTEQSKVTMLMYIVEMLAQIQHTHPRHE